MKIAIIGAAGFVGKVLFRICKDSGHDVCGYDVVDREDSDTADIEHLDVLTDKVEFAHGTDCVFYLAQSPFYREFPRCGDHLFGVNVQGAIKAATAAHERNVNFFCYASTGNVYQPSLAPRRESHPLRRDEPYALSKVMAEDALKLFRSPMTVLCARLFGVFGAGQKTMLPVRLREMVKAGQPITLAPAPQEMDNPQGLKISLCYVDDVARCLIRLAQLAADGNSLPLALNIAGPEPISIRQFAETAGELMGIEPIFQTASEPRSFDLIAETSELQSLISPEFTPFDEAMSRTIPH